MCGRYALSHGLAEILSHFAANTALSGWNPHYNMGPGMNLPVIVKGRLGLMRWGWPNQGPKPLINIRSETAAKKPSFARAWTRGQHALIPASGFYEWDASGQPYYVQDPALPIMALKALWTRDADNLPCFAILTGAANAVLAPIHPRMPQMTDVRGVPVTDVQPVPISRAVNDITRNSAALLEPATGSVQGNLWIA